VIAKLCNTAILFSGGKIAAEGDASNVGQQYLDAVSTHSGAFFKAECEGKEPAYLRSAEILDSTGAPSSTLKFGEPFSIRMQWRHKSPLRGLIYSIRVFDSRERDVFAVNTKGQEHLHLHRGGDHVVTTEFPVNILPPGQFTFTITAWQMPGEMVQMLERCMTVTVSSTPFDPDHRFEVAGSPAASVRAAWHAESNLAGA
jgi:hypothetical protein